MKNRISVHESHLGTFNGLRQARELAAPGVERDVSRLIKAPILPEVPVQRMASMPLRRTTLRSASAGPLARFAPRSSCET